MKTIPAVSGITKTLPDAHNYCYFKNDNYKNLNQKTIEIVPKSLKDIIESTSIKHFDFLSLDVEGHEYEVLESWDFSIPIDMIMIELFDDCGLTPDELINKQKCINILKKNNYKYICNLNDYNLIYILKDSELDKFYDFQDKTIQLKEKYSNIKKVYSI